MPSYNYYNCFQNIHTSTTKILHYSLFNFFSFFLIYYKIKICTLTYEILYFYTQVKKNFNVSLFWWIEWFGTRSWIKRKQQQVHHTSKRKRTYCCWFKYMFQCIASTIHIVVHFWMKLQRYGFENFVSF